MEQILAGEATPAQIGALAVALRMKGRPRTRSPAWRRRCAAACRRSAPRRSPLLDTCGTGGDNAGTFNISTTVALVDRGRAAWRWPSTATARSRAAPAAPTCSSRWACASTSPPRTRARSLDMLGITFLFAPNYHTALRHAAARGARSACAPCSTCSGRSPTRPAPGASCSGVFSDQLVRPVAEVLQRLGSERAWVVHGRDGMDELTVFAASHVVELAGGTLREFDVDPAKLGLAHQDRAGVAGGDAARQRARASARCWPGRRAPRATSCCSTRARRWWWRTWPRTSRPGLRPRRPPSTAAPRARSFEAAAGVSQPIWDASSGSGPERRMAMFCARCGKPLPEGAAFCPGCGAPVGQRGDRAPLEPGATPRTRSAPRGLAADPDAGAVAAAETRASKRSPRLSAPGTGRAGW